jgi:hypothetical protein
VLVPKGSEVRTLTVFSGGAVSFHRVVQKDEPSAAGVAFPLVAYRHFCEDVRPDEFGLDQPRLRVAIGRASGESRDLLVGSANFTGGGIYASEPGSPCVYLVTASDIHRLARLAGEDVAAPFAPPPKPELAPGEDGDQARPDPWVEQTERHDARTGAKASLDREGRGS